MSELSVLTEKGGTPSEIAERLTTPERKCSRQLVEYWLERGYVTGNWAPHVSCVYGIPPHELNSKLYPPEFRIAAPAGRSENERH